MLEKRDESLKEIKVRKIPDNWEVSTLESLCKIAHRYAFEGQYITDTPTDYVLVTPTNFAIGGGFKSDKLRYYRGLIEEDYVLNPGDIIVTMTDLSKKGDTLGYPAIIPSMQGKIFLHNQRLGKIRILSQKITTEFLLFTLCSNSYREHILETATGTPVRHTSPQKILAYSVALPPLHEQKKIAAILSSVDEAIASTQAIINQTRKVKQGLLQQLLTRGKHSDKKDVVGTKKAPLRLLDEVAKRVTGHTPNRKKPEYWDGGIKWVSLQDSAALDRVYIHETAVEISEEGIRNSSAVKHPKGTVVLSRDAGVGKSAITTDEMAVSQHFIGWICDSELDNHYLYYWLQYMKPVFEEIAIGSTIKTIGMPFFKSFKIPVPPIETQIQIASKLLSTDKQFFFAEEELKQLNILKRGLMQDLLTGKVRVYSQE
jgi:type I restriction enzyme S subunit